VAWSERSPPGSTTRALASSAQRPAFALRATARRAGYAIEPLRRSHAGPRSRCGCRPGSTSRRSHGVGAFAAGRGTTPRRVCGRAGKRGVAVDRAQPDGDQFEKHRPRRFSGPSPVTAIPRLPARRLGRYAVMKSALAAVTACQRPGTTIGRHARSATQASRRIAAWR
jgi:hypothetical protein